MSKKKIKIAVDSLSTDNNKKDIIYHYVIALFSEFELFIKKPLAENILIEVYQAYLSNNLGSLGYIGYSTNKKQIMKWMVKYCTTILQDIRMGSKEIKLITWKNMSSKVYKEFEEQINPMGKILYVR